MKPSRESAFVDLLDRILVKGVILHADVIVTVADIPLIGINLRAAIAGMKTMLDYGIMEAWDEKIRRIALEENDLEDLQLEYEEKIIYRSHVTFRTEGKTKSNWMHGHLYLTNQRLLIVRRKPWEILLDLLIDHLDDAELIKSNYLKRDRNTLQITKGTGLNEFDVKIISSDVKILMLELREQMTRIHAPLKPHVNAYSDPSR